MEQKSKEWHIARMGKITGSQFVDAMGSMAARNRLIKKLTTERQLLAKGGDDLDQYVFNLMSVSAPALEWGNNHEDQAVAAFELKSDLDVIKSGFTPHVIEAYRDFVGCSLDGEIHDNGSMGCGIIEVKCPYNPENHAHTLQLGMPSKHTAQIHGNMWNTGYEYGYFISFDPRAEPENRLYIQLIYRDDQYIQDLATNCLIINEHVEAETLIEPPESVNLF